MKDSLPVPLESSLQTFAIAALRLALNFVEEARAIESRPDGEALLSILSREDWKHFTVRTSPAGSDMHVALIPSELIQGTLGKLLERFGVESIGPASRVLVGLLDETGEANE